MMTGPTWVLALESNQVSLAYEASMESVPLSSKNTITQNWCKRHDSNVQRSLWESSFTD